MKFLLSVLLSFTLVTVKSQDINILLKEADNFEKQQKESEALDKYSQVLLQQPVHIKALVKSADLNASLGNRQTDKNSKRLHYETALSFATRAYNADSTQADASYAMSMASYKMLEVETENKKLVAYAKDMKKYADKALAINPEHAKANYMLGKWHYEMTNLSGVKKAAVKALYGGIPESSFDQAFLYMEKCKTLEPYFAANYLDLAKAYKADHKPAQAMEILAKLVKLPTRVSDDVAIKAEGAKLLESMQ